MVLGYNQMVAITKPLASKAKAAPVTRSNHITSDPFENMITVLIYTLKFLYLMYSAVKSAD